MKFTLSERFAYVIAPEPDGFKIYDCHGFIMEPEQAYKVAEGVKNFAKKHGKEIREHNQRRQIELEQELRYGYYDRKEPSKRDTTGHVYLFECGGKYKIGFSKNVPRRLKELDHRPFKIKIITKSRLLEDGFDIEQKLHLESTAQRIDGEWYSFDDKEVDRIKNYIDNL